MITNCSLTWESSFSHSILKYTTDYLIVESFRFEDEDEDEDEDEALCFRHNEIFKLFHLQLGRDNVVAINFVVPAKLKTKKFEDFVVVKTESFVLVLDFVLVLESKALQYLKFECIAIANVLRFVFHSQFHLMLFNLEIIAFLQSFLIAHFPI